MYLYMTTMFNLTTSFFLIITKEDAMNAKSAKWRTTLKTIVQVAPSGECLQGNGQGYLIGLLAV